MITQELVAALDDLLQAGAQASASLRAKLDSQIFLQAPDLRNSLINTVEAARAEVTGAASVERNEQTIPGLASAAANVVSRLIAVANQLGESDMAGALSIRLQRARGAGAGAFPWLLVLGIGGAAVAAFIAWKMYRRRRMVAAYEAPEDDDTRPRLRNMSKVLGSFRGRPSGCRSRPRMGAPPEKYEFEPEVRLEGHRGGSSRRYTRSRR